MAELMAPRTGGGAHTQSASTAAAGSASAGTPAATAGSSSVGGPGGNDASAGLPYYEKLRSDLKDLITRKRVLEKRLAANEETIAAKEREYLDSTPWGNIITGFDNYTKAGSGSASAAQRRKTGPTDANRIFSRSSISYNPNAVDTGTPNSTASTPGPSHAPTPVSTSFAGANGNGSVNGHRESAGSAAATPTSTTATTTKAGGNKKRKASTAAAAAAAAATASAASAADDNSETDSREPGNKKVRTNFGAVRK